MYAPYPTLVSVGHTPAGEQWLLDLEHIGYLSLTGDTERCMDLARFIAAELAHNAWSDTVDVTLVGFGAEMTALNPERLTHTDHLDTATAAASRVLADDTAERDATRRTVLDADPHPGLGGPDTARHPRLADRGPAFRRTVAVEPAGRTPLSPRPRRRRRGLRRG